MTQKERLLGKLFDSVGVSHVNIKFFRGSSEDMSSEDLCEAANMAIFQAESGLAKVRNTFGDADLRQVDVEAAYVSQ